MTKKAVKKFSEKEEKHEGCGCGGHGHDHGHDHHEGCGCGDEHLEHFVVDLEDEEGNTITNSNKYIKRGQIK